MATMPGLEELAITIIDTITDRPHGLPVRPIDDGTQYTDGEQQPTTVTILDVGPVDIPGTTTDLDSITWNSFFPGSYDPSLCDVNEASLKTPEAYRNQFSTWKDKGTPLRLVWPWAHLNKPVYLKSFSWQPPNAMGDIFYSVTFREVKTIGPKKVTPNGQAISSGKQAADRDPVPKQKAAGPLSTYTVKAGDTLTGIAKKLGLSPWRAKLYEPNKAVIGPNPDRINSGMVLKI